MEYPDDFDPAVFIRKRSVVTLEEDSSGFFSESPKHSEKNLSSSGNEIFSPALKVNNVPKKTAHTFFSVDVLRNLLMVVDKGASNGWEGFVESVRMVCNEVVPSEECNLWLLNDEGTKLITFKEDGMMVPIDIPEEGSSIRECLEHGKPVIQDASETGKLIESCAGNLVTTRLCVQVRTGSNHHTYQRLSTADDYKSFQSDDSRTTSVGFLELLNNKGSGQGEGFNEQDQLALAAAADIAALAFSNAWHSEHDMLMIKRTKALLDSSKSLMSAVSTRQMFCTLRSVVPSLVGFKVVNMYLYEDETNCLYTDDADLGILSIPLQEHSAIVDCFVECQSIVIKKCKKHDNFNPLVDQPMDTEAKNMVLVPIRHPTQLDTTMGVLQLCNKKDYRMGMLGSKLPNDEDVAFLEVLCGHIALAMHTIFMIENATTSHRTFDFYGSVSHLNLKALNENHREEDSTPTSPKSQLDKNIPLRLFLNPEGSLSNQPHGDDLPPCSKVEVASTPQSRLAQSSIGPDSDSDSEDADKYISPTTLIDRMPGFSLGSSQGNNPQQSWTTDGQPHIDRKPRVSSDSSKGSAHERRRTRTGCPKVLSRSTSDKISVGRKPRFSFELSKPIEPERRRRISPFPVRLFLDPEGSFSSQQHDHDCPPHNKAEFASTPQSRLAQSSMGPESESGLDSWVHPSSAEIDQSSPESSQGNNSQRRWTIDGQPQIDENPRVSSDDSKRSYHDRRQTIAGCPRYWRYSVQSSKGSDSQGSCTTTTGCPHMKWRSVSHETESKLAWLLKDDIAHTKSLPNCWSQIPASQNYRLRIRMNSELSQKDMEELHLNIQEMDEIMRASICDLPQDMSASELCNPDLDLLTFSKSQLCTFTLAIFHAYGLPQKFDMDEDKLRAFILKIQNHYEDNPFHNWYHAVTVLHTAFVTVNAIPDINSLFGPIDLLAIFLTALAHDMDHTGQNNTFHMQTLSEFALRYNDKSVLEMHSASMLFTTLTHPDYNILAALSKEDFFTVRSLILSAVLDTDLSVHGLLLSRFSSFLDYPIRRDGNLENRKLMCSIFVHAADLSNPTRNIKQAKQWSELLAAEMCMQANLERSLNIPVAPFMENLDDPIVLARNEIHFIATFAQPLWMSMATLVPALVFRVVNIQANLEYYHKLNQTHE